MKKTLFGFLIKSLLRQVIIGLTVLFVTRLLFYCWNWGWFVAVFIQFLNDLLDDFLLSAMDRFPLSIGGDGSGASSSKRPRLDIDLNGPPLEEPEPDHPQEDQPLSQAELHTIFRLAGRVEAPNARLLEEVRAIVRLKGQLVDRMMELDPNASGFWQKQRKAILEHSILSTNQREHSSHK